LTSELIIFGSGSSETSPCHGCFCDVCTEAIISNHIRSNSTYLYHSTTDANIFLDYGTPVVSNYGLSHLKIAAVLLTHTHSDHVLGLYTLRWSRNKIKVYYPEGDIHQDFLPIVSKSFNLEIERLRPFESLKLAGATITPLPLNHSIPTLGFLVEDSHYPVALLSDTKGIPSDTYDLLREKNNLIALVDAAISPEHTNSYHNNILEAIEIIQSLPIKLGILTHISHNNWTNARIIEYLKSQGLSNISLAFDNMVIFLDNEVITEIKENPLAVLQKLSLIK